MTSHHLSDTPLWDAIVIGGGSAGLAAAQMLGRSLRRTLVIDGGSPRNRFATHAHGILALDGTPPEEILARGRAELDNYGVEVRTGLVDAVADHGGTLAVTAGSVTEHTRALVLATGITDVLPEVPGLAKRWGASVIHCPYCHGWEVRGTRIGVLVAAPGQVHLAFMVRQLSPHVTVFLQEDGLIEASDRERLEARGVTVVDSAVEQIAGAGRDIEGVRTADGRTHAIDALFAGGAPRPHDEALAALDLDRTDALGTSLIAVQPDGATSHPRVWAAGNVVDPMANVPMAASAGAMAGARVNGFLVGEDFDSAVAARAGA